MALLDIALPGISRDAGFTFTGRPLLVLPDDRLSYRLALLICSLRFCKGQRSSYGRLALLNFASRSAARRTQLLRAARMILTPSDAGVRFDPFFPRALSIAGASKLIESRSGGTVFALLSAGRKVFESMEVEGLFPIERSFFRTVAPELPETMVKDILKDDLR